MAQRTIDPDDRRLKRVLPNAVALLGEANAHVVGNLLADAPGDVRGPSLWRTAKLVVTERAPLAVYSFATKR